MASAYEQYSQDKADGIVALTKEATNFFLNYTNFQPHTGTQLPSTKEQVDLSLLDALIVIRQQQLDSLNLLKSGINTFPVSVSLSRSR